MPFFCKKYRLTRQEYNKLRHKQALHLAQASRLLLKENNADGAAQALQKVKTGDELLALCYSRSICRFFPLAAVVICFAGVSLLVRYHKCDLNVRLKLETKTAMLTLAEKSAWKWQPQPDLTAESIRIEEISSIKAPGIGMSGAAEQLTANGKSITLEYIEASGGSRIEVERNDGFIHLYISEGKVNGKFELQESKLQIFSGGTAAVKDISGPISETIEFKAAVKGGNPLHLRLKTSKDFHLDGLQISNMALQREEPPRSGSFVSTIVGGTVALPEVEREKELEEHDWLRLKEASSTRLRLTFAEASKDSFNLFFQGTARSLSAGPVGFEKDLNPSLLLWLYHNKELTIFWGALAFAYSLLLGLRSMLEKK